MEFTGTSIFVGMGVGLFFSVVLAAWYVKQNEQERD
jgi:hypothetical protein